MKSDNPILGTNGQLMVMAAHRYSLGRRSYIVSSCIEWLTDNWKSFDTNTRTVIVRDTVEALMDNMAGSDIDFREWKYFAESKFAQLQPDDQKSVFESVQHKNKPWPLSQ